MSTCKEIKAEPEVTEVCLSVDHHIQSSCSDSYSDFGRALESELRTQPNLVSDWVKTEGDLSPERFTDQTCDTPIDEEDRESYKTKVKTDPAECFDDFLKDFIKQGASGEEQSINETRTDILILTDCTEGKGVRVCHTLTYKCKNISKEGNTKRQDLTESSKPRKSHRKDKNETLVSKSQKKNMKKQDGHREKEHFCSICGRGYFHKCHLSAHMKTHTEHRPFSCPECGASFHHNDRLQAHLIIHSETRVTRSCNCDECGKSFFSIWTLREHQLRHKGERTHRCAECGKKFKTSSDLTVHLQIHTGEKPFTCTECGTSFSRSFTLQKHMRIHTGERPFLCSLCGKTFPYAHSYNSHMKIHQRGSRPL